MTAKHITVFGGTHGHLELMFHSAFTTLKDVQASLSIPYSGSC